jgi:hypothetical protein
MLHALRMDPIQVQMELLQQGDDEDGVSQKVMNRRGGKCRAPPNEFLFLRTRIRNISRKSRVGFRLVRDVLAVLGPNSDRSNFRGKHVFRA